MLGPQPLALRAYPAARPPSHQNVCRETNTSLECGELLTASLQRFAGIHLRNETRTLIRAGDLLAEGSALEAGAVWRVPSTNPTTQLAFTIGSVLAPEPATMGARAVRRVFATETATLRTGAVRLVLPTIFVERLFGHGTRTAYIFRGNFVAGLPAHSSGGVSFMPQGHRTPATNPAKMATTPVSRTMCRAVTLGARVI